jgi:transposase
VIEASVIEAPDVCLSCGSTKLPYHFGRRDRQFFDLPIRMRPVLIHAIRHRYRCRDCSATFLDALPGMDERYEATERLIRCLQVQALDPTQTFVRLAHQLGISEAYVRKVALASIEQMERDYVIQTPRYLGIDEIVLDRPWCVLTDLEGHCLLDVLAKREMSTVKKWLGELPNASCVEVVVMDHWNPYRLSVREILPQAKIVVDKYHVVRQVNEVVETVRKSFRTSLPASQQKQLKQDRKILLKRAKDLTAQQQLILESWTGTYPLLHDLQALKEEFYDIYDARSEQEGWDRSIAQAEGISQRRSMRRFSLFN